MSHPTRVTLLFVLLGWSMAVEPAWAVYPPPIKDSGEFFSKEALQEADRLIRSIYDKYKKDVVIETLAELTPQQMKQMEDEGRTKYFTRVAAERAKSLGVNGAYVVFIKKPQHYQFYVDPETQRTVFKLTDRNRTIQRIVERFKEKQFDRGLLDGIRSIESAMNDNTPAKQQ